MRTALERFDRKWSTAAGGCWLWSAAISSTGYGAFSMSAGTLTTSHRASYMLRVGPVPDGLFVLHHCDIRRCVNPAHLFLGTHADNMRDMATKGRDFRGPPLRGESNGMSKIRATDAAVIRALSSGGLSQRVIAARFNLSQSTVWAIINNKTWREAAISAEVAAKEAAKGKQ